MSRKTQKYLDLSGDYIALRSYDDIVKLPVYEQELEGATFEARQSQFFFVGDKVNIARANPIFPSENTPIKICGWAMQYAPPRWRSHATPSALVNSRNDPSTTQHFSNYTAGK
ncbi:hypothetical protein [Parapedobacter lycopersici]|uniref:hypothetical protein n=1 Tax=Parapedobacter lycopersici TaxID=1864939 RepID=UPI00214D198F|nr:hypothetical protein [Parapedobacter lycopersici]